MGGWEAAAGAGWEQVFAAENNRHARKVFEANTGRAPDVGDILATPASAAPFAHVYTCSFPCQSSSQAGVRKGSQDPRGQQVLDKALKMIGHAQPLIVVFENVKGFLSVEQGGYFSWLRERLQAIGFPRFEWRVLATHHFSLPQQRERLYMVAFREDIASLVNFHFPEGDVTKTPSLTTFLRRRLTRKYALTVRCGGRGSKDRHQWDCIRRVNGGWYQLTVTDCKRLMGFSKSYKMSAVPRTQQFRLLGNAITLEPARSLMRECKRVIYESYERSSSKRPRVA